MDEYGSLNTASLGTEYLMTNATTHSFIFGAMAELVDNARDAGSKTLEIYTEESEDRSGGPMLCFKDDGCGMSKEEAESVIVFGSSRKTDQEEPIGMYGNGLKSGSMRLGKDMILFTKKDGVLTCLMISRTFYEAESVTQIKVPVPSFHASTKTMVGSDRKKHSVEVSLITKYSPFKTELSLLSQFNSLKGDSGTLVIIYNLSTTPNGELELDFSSDPVDIKASVQLDHENSEDDDVIERRSFRAYASILYKSPRMKIILQKKRVRTRLLAYSLYLPKRILVNYKSFKNQNERQINEAKKQIEVTRRKLTEIQSQISTVTKNSSNVANRNVMMQVRRLQNVEAEHQQQLAERQGIMELRKKQAKKSEQLEFHFGLNANERYHDGIFFYNSDRLIKMYVKEGTLQSKEEITYRGIIAVVSVPKSSLLPTHNKQDFNDHAEYKKLKKCVDQAMQQYWDEVVMDEWKHSLVKGWQQLGYSQDWRSPPSEEEKYKIRRARIVKHLQQCDKCLKWRVIPYHKNYLYQDFPDSWQCSNSLDPSSSSCAKPEVLPKIESSHLKHKSLLKATEPPPKKIAPSKKMSAAYQEKIRQEERKRKAAEADKLHKELLKKSKPQPKPSASATPTPASALKSSPATRKLQQSPSNSRSASAATSAAASSSKAKKLPTSPVLPLRQMRRPSPSRVIRKLETESPSASSTSKSSIKQDTEVEPMDTSEEPSAATSRLESSPQSSSKLSTSAVKVETTTPVPSKAAPKDVPVEKPKNYRIVGMRDITRGGLVVGAKVQGRYQSKWQDAEILEIRPDNVLVKFGNKISLAMKVKNPDKNVEGELRVEAEEDDEGGEVSQPSSTTTDEAEATPSTGYTATHHKKLVDLVKSLDESLDTDSLSLSNLADLDVAALLAQYTVKKQKDAVATSQEETSKQINQLRTELDAKTKETKMIKEEFTRREEERFEKIRDLFSRVLSVCIGAGPESRFTTYEELVDLLENIAESLAE